MAKISYYKYLTLIFQSIKNLTRISQKKSQTLAKGEKHRQRHRNMAQTYMTK